MPTTLKWLKNDKRIESGTIVSASANNTTDFYPSPIGFLQYSYAKS